jgi:hypothetical protein
MSAMNEMIDAWLAVLPEKRRKSAKSDLKTALNGLSDDDVLERVRDNPTDLLDVAHRLFRRLQKIGEL